MDPSIHSSIPISILRRLLKSERQELIIGSSQAMLKRFVAQAAKTILLSGARFAFAMLEIIGDRDTVKLDLLIPRSFDSFIDVHERTKSNA